MAYVHLVTCEPAARAPREVPGQLCALGVSVGPFPLHGTDGVSGGGYHLAT